MSGVSGVVNDVNEQGITLGNLESYTTFIRSAVMTDERHVTLTYCGEDGVVQVRPTPTGDIILNGAFVSGIAEATMVLGDDGEWRVEEFNTLQEQASTEEDSLCAAG